MVWRPLELTSFHSMVEYPVQWQKPRELIHFLVSEPRLYELLTEGVHLRRHRHRVASGEGFGLNSEADDVSAIVPLFPRFPAGD